MKPAVAFLHTTMPDQYRRVLRHTTTPPRFTTRTVLLAPPPVVSRLASPFAVLPTELIDQIIFSAASPGDVANLARASSRCLRSLCSYSPARRDELLSRTWDHGYGTLRVLRDDMTTLHAFVVAAAMPSMHEQAPLELEWWWIVRRTVGDVRVGTFFSYPIIPKSVLNFNSFIYIKGLSRRQTLSFTLSSPSGLIQSASITFNQRPNKITSITPFQ
jgi:hypothetical protein